MPFLGRQIPTIFSPLILNEHNYPHLQTVLPSDGGSTVVDILQKYLCGEDEETGLEVSGSELIHVPNEGRNVFLVNFTGTFPSNQLFVGSNVTIRLNNFPNKFKIISIEHTSMRIKVLDDEFEYVYGSQKPDLFLSRKIYKSYMGWKSLSYEVGKHIVVKPNSLKSNCLALIAVTDANKDDPLYAINQGNAEVLEEQNPVIDNLATSESNGTDNLYLHFIPLFNYESNKSLEYNLERYKCSITNYLGLNVNKKLYYGTPVFYNRMCGGTKTNIYSEVHEYKYSLVDSDKWVLVGDDKFFMFVIPNRYKNSGSFNTVLVFGEMEVSKNKTSFVWSGVYTRSLSKNSVPFDVNNGVFVTDPENSKKYFLSSTKVHPIITTENSSFISKGMYRSDNYVFPYGIYYYLSNSLVDVPIFKVIEGEEFLVIPSYYFNILFPISKSFRY